MQSTVKTVSTRILIQNALRSYRDEKNNTLSNWESAQADLSAALAGGDTLLLQAVIFPANGDGPTQQGLLNATSDKVTGNLELPFRNSTGANIMLGDPGLGYPPSLYPNLTYATTADAGGSSNQTSALAYAERPITQNSSLLLGPLQINSTFGLLSLTVPVVNNTSYSDILGYLTVVVNARLIYDVVLSPEGVDNSGGVLIVGPEALDNRFPPQYQSDHHVIAPDNGSAAADLPVKILFAAFPSTGAASRHVNSGFGKPNPSFPTKQYPVVQSSFTQNNGALNNAGSQLSSSNEEGKSVAVGYAIPQTTLCDWVLVVEQDHYQALTPVRHLRNVLLACVFGTVGVILLFVFPIAHFSVRPIRRLRQATKDSVQAPGYGPDSAPRSSQSEMDRQDGQAVEADEGGHSKELKGSFRRRLTPWRIGRRKDTFHGGIITQDHAVRIPRKVQDRKHYVEDELTDLTRTFNEMSDELMMQYERLEERVQERTRELELSKKAAEAANESKTLFIANISHEFRTPLNAILGLTAVCMEEAEMTKIQRSLGIIYKSGDLLLHLLTDLLTFSKNQMGQQLTLEEKEFRLGDIGAQILSIFEKQATEGSIDLKASYSMPNGDLSDKPEMPFRFTRLKDLYVWGDQNRILQVAINLVGNSLKFTPPGQSIELRIKCLSVVDAHTASPKASTHSKRNSLRPSRIRKRRSDSSGTPPSVADDASNYLNTALAINPLETELNAKNRPASPLPQHSTALLFEFEVEDSGPGIPENLQERVFEPFVQGDLGLSKRYGGTGLGLSICSQLAKLMKGSITLRSQVGVGSVFTMRIPLKVTGVRPGSNTSSTSNLHSRPSSMALAGSSDEMMTTASRPKLNNDLTTASLDSKNEPPSSPPIGAAGKSSVVGSKPRLVGLSQPFFASSTSLESPEERTTADAAVAEASKRGDRIRVLVAEDNKVNQEVVLRMLKLEDIYGRFSREPRPKKLVALMDAV